MAKHDPILVPAGKFDDHQWGVYWKWWCPCGNGAKSPDTYEGASSRAHEHVKAKGDRP